MVERAMLMAGGNRLELDSFKGSAVESPSGGQKPQSIDGCTLDDLERQAITAALARYGGNLSLVATALGISRQALYRRMEKYGITQ